MKESFAIVGCGKVGCALAKQMKSSGYTLAGLASKSITSAQKAASQLDTDIFSDKSWEITKSADVVFITTPDGQIQEAASLLANKNGLKKNAVVLHCSGAQPSTILLDVKKCEVSIGSLHPLQSFASTEIQGNPFTNIIAAVEGEPDAVSIASRIAQDLGANCLTIKTNAKTAYHAAAVVASNYLVTIQDLAFKLLQIAGIPAEDAFQVLGPLVQGTLSNIEKVGTEKALTGPIVRGDTETVGTHVDEIHRMAPELLGLYQILGQYTVHIAESGGNITKDRSEELIRILTKKK
jgi:predicted short-subunit dehydrogenase-like oxidoreductase (DUF2520 family)